jgi:hypothetical protein
MGRDQAHDLDQLHKILADRMPIFDRWGMSADRGLHRGQLVGLVLLGCHQALRTRR